MTNTHLIKDETLGGLLREYIEVEGAKARKADVGDKVIVRFDSTGRFNAGDIVNVEFVDGYDVFAKHIRGNRNGCAALVFESEEYRTLDPTDIVHVEGERYKLVDRKASVGEKVIYFYEGKSDGIVTEALKVRASDIGVAYEDSEGDQVCGIDHGAYLVLEPVEANAEPTVEVNASQASPEIIEMLANLSRRIVRLEDEIDTLHANQKRMAEEMENVKAGADESLVIVELAKLLVEASRRESRMEGVR